MVEQNTFTDALLEGAGEVFEMMMFMMVDPCEEDAASIEGDALLGSITFRGDIEGCLAVSCGMDCAKAIAINMLGLDSEDEISDAEVPDAIGEVANMVMGAVKTRIMDCVGDIQVSIPTVVSGKELMSSLGDQAVEINLPVNIDEYPARFTFLYRDVSGSN